MRSTKLLALVSVCPMMLAVQGCALFAAGPPLLATTPAACSSFVPDAWRVAVASAALTNGGLELGDWIKFGDAQTGQLDKANERLSASLGIIERCEARDAAAVKKATRRKVLGIF